MFSNYHFGWLRAQNCSEAKYMIHHARYRTRCWFCIWIDSFLHLRSQMFVHRRSGGLASVMRGISSVRLGTYFTIRSSSEIGIVSMPFILLASYENQKRHIHVHYYYGSNARRL